MANGGHWMPLPTTCIVPDRKFSNNNNILYVTDFNIFLFAMRRLQCFSGSLQGVSRRPERLLHKGVGGSAVASHLSQALFGFPRRLYVRQRGSVAAWQRGSVAAWQRGSVAAWQRGSVAAWQRGSVAAWQRGSVAAWPVPAAPADPPTIQHFGPQIGPLRAHVAVTGRNQKTLADVHGVEIGAQGFMLDPQQDRDGVAARRFAGGRIQAIQQRAADDADGQVQTPTPAIDSTFLQRCR